MAAVRPACRPGELRPVLAPDVYLASLHHQQPSGHNRPNEGAPWNSQIVLKLESTVLQSMGAKGIHVGSLLLLHCLIFASSSLFAVELLVVPEQAHTEWLPAAARDIFLDPILPLNPLMQRKDIVILATLLQRRQTLREREQ